MMNTTKIVKVNIELNKIVCLFLSLVTILEKCKDVESIYYFITVDGF